MVFGFGKKDKKGPALPGGEVGGEGDTASPGETNTDKNKPSTPSASKKPELDEDGRDVNDMTLPTEDNEKKKGRCNCCRMKCCKCGRKTPEERARIQVRIPRLTSNYNPLLYQPCWKRLNKRMLKKHLLFRF